MAKKFVLEAGPFEDSTIDSVARSWGWQESAGVTAEAYVASNGKKRFADILAQPKTIEAIQQIDTAAQAQKIAVRQQVLDGTMQLVAFSIVPVVIPVASPISGDTTV